MREYQHHILYIVAIAIAILFSLIIISDSNIGSNNSNVSALSYSSSIGVGFTFNPTLSVNISPSDLVIPNLTPGTTDNSNIINVSVDTNAAYGYTLSAIMNGNNNDLTRTNGTNIFSSIATNADLSDLDNSEDTNIWGYSTSLDNGTTWSNYNGLSSSNSTTLINTNSNVSSNLDFKIAAKAASTQASGTYTSTINFTAVANPTPMNLAESYFAAGKTRHNGYYAMQDMTTEICSNTEVIGEGSQTELIDLRDNKVYWATKLADGHCWMTQNLDFDIIANIALNSNTTDINAIYNSSTGQYAEYDDGYNFNNNVIYWIPASGSSTIDFSGTTVTGWQNTFTKPYSANKTDDIETGHASLGNYYNWTAAIASNESSSLTNSTFNDTSQNPKNSICPKGWRLPTISSESESLINSTNEFAKLSNLYGNNLNIWLRSPLYFVKNGSAATNITGSYDAYWSSTVVGSYSAYNLFLSDRINTSDNSRKMFGWPIRCIAK